MSDYKIKTFEPEIYKVTDKGDTLLNPSTDVVYSEPIDLLPTKKDGSFNNLRLYRQNDFVLQSVEVIGNLDHDSYDYSEFIPSGLKIKITLSTSSDVTKIVSKELEYNDSHVNYVLYKQDSQGKISKQSDKKIYPETIKATFTVTYGNSTQSCDYNIYHTKKLIKIELKSWTDKQYTDTDIDFTYLKLNAYFDGYSVPSVITSSDVDTNKTKWENKTGVQKVTFTYTFDESSSKYTFNPQTVSTTVNKNDIIIKSPTSINLTKIVFNNVQFYKDLPSFSYEANVNYNNGSTKVISNNSDIFLYVSATGSVYAEGQDYYTKENNQFIKKTDVVIGEKIGSNIYSNKWVTHTDESYSEEIILNYAETLIDKTTVFLNTNKYYNRVYRKLQSLQIDNLEEQFENKKINLDNKQFIVTYNNDKTITGKLSDLSFTIDKTHYNGKWIFSETEKDPTKQVNVLFTYKGTQNQSISEITVATVHRRAPVKFELNKSTSSPTQQITNTIPKLSGLNFNIYYNNGDVDYNYTVYSNINVIYNDNPILIWPKLSGEDLTVFSYDKYENCKFKLISDDLCTEETLSFNVGRKPKKIQPLKSDKITDFKFNDNKHFKGTRVDLTGLDYFKITYEDGSIVEFDLTNKSTGDKVNTLKNSYVYIYLESWLTSSEQTNYFYFQIPKSTIYPFTFDKLYSTKETLKFSDIITGFNVTVKTKINDKRVFFYQNEEVLADLETKFNFILTILSSIGTESTVTVSYDKLKDYNCKVHCRLNNTPITKWPVAITKEEQEEKSIYENIKFVCDPDEEGSFEQLFDVVNYMQFFRRLTAFKLRAGETDKITDERYFGKYISEADYIYKKYSLTFNNSFTIEPEDILSDYLHITPKKWSSKHIDTSTNYPYFDIYYSENGDDNEDDFKVNPIRLYGTNVTSNAISMSVVQNTKKVITAGTKFADYIKGGYFEYVVKDLEGNIIPEDGTHITVLPEESGPTETSKYVTFTYNGKVESGMTVAYTLEVKLTLSKYKIFIKCEEGASPSKSEIEYSPSLEPQSFKLSINILAEDECSYNGITVSEDVNITYSIYNKLLTIPSKLTGDYTVYVHLKKEYITDEDYVFYDGTKLNKNNCNKYFIDNDSTLTRVKFNNNNNGYCFIPNGVKTVLQSNSIFYKNIKIKHLGIGSTVTRINDNAFESCPYLEDIIFTTTNNLTIGQNAFLGCVSLSKLDFLKCGKMTENNFLFGTPDSDPLNNNKVVRNVWEGCALRNIKITQNNFNPVVRHYYIDNSIGNYNCWLTGRSAGGFKFLFESRESDGNKNNAHRKTYICSMIEPNDGNGHEDINRAVSNGKLQKMLYYEVNGKGYGRGGYYRTYENSSSYLYVNDYKPGKKSSRVSNSYYVSEPWDLRKKCSIVTQSDINCNLWLVCYGLGWSLFDYINIINCDYRFTTNGRTNLEFVSAERDGKGYHFGNWDMLECVNDCVYPNIKLGNGSNMTEAQVDALVHIDSPVADRDNYNDSIYQFGTMLDYMIPIY